MRPESRPVRILWDTVGLTLLLLILAYPVCIFLRVPYPIVIVGSGSMQPTLSVGDVLVIVPFGDVQVGDIVYIRVGAGSYLHRVVELVSTPDGGKGVITKGDANRATDQSMQGLSYSELSDVKGRALSVAGLLVVVPKIGVLIMQARGVLLDLANSIGGPIVLIGFFGFIAAVMLLTDFRGDKGSHKPARIPYFLLLFPALVAGLCYVNLSNSWSIPVRMTVDPRSGGILVNGGRVLLPGQSYGVMVNVTNQGSFPTLSIVRIDGDLKGFFSQQGTVARLLGGQKKSVCFTATAPQVSEPMTASGSIQVLNVPFGWILPTPLDFLMTSVDPVIAFVLANCFVASFVYLPFLMVSLIVTKARNVPEAGA
jgi:signal peptidase I